MATDPTQVQSNVLPPVVIRDFSVGMHTNASPALTGDNVLKYIINMYNTQDKTNLGTLKSRPGITILSGDTIDTDIAGVGSDDKIVGMTHITQNSFIAAVEDGSNVYTYYYASGWQDIGGTPFAWDSGSQIRFEKFVGYVFALQTAGNSANMKSWDGDAGHNWGSTNLTGAPTGMKHLKAYKGRLYVAGTDSKVYFSSLPDGSNNISWDTTNDFFEVDPHISGEVGVYGFDINSDLLLILKKKTFHVWDGQTLTKISDVGCISQEVIQTIETNTFFVNQKNGYLSINLYNGSTPTDISSPVREFLYNANLNANPESFGSWQSGNNYFLSIGDVTIENDSYKNIILQYSLDTGSWCVFSINKKSGAYNNFFKYFSYYFQASSISSPTNYGNIPTTSGFIPYVVIGGNPLGTLSTNNVAINPVIWSFTSSNGDDVGEATNNPIEILIQTKELELGSRATLKQLNKFFIYADGNYGFVNVDIRADGGQWIPKGQLTGRITEIEHSIQGHYFEIRLSGSNTGEQFIFEGFEFPSITVEPYET